MNYSYVEIEYVATIFSPIRTDLALKLLMPVPVVDRAHTGTEPKCKNANTGTGTIF